MAQTTGRFFDDIVKFMTDSAGVAQGMRAEFETAMFSQAEKFMRSFHVPQREEFEAVKAMAEKAREENEKLAHRISELEGIVAKFRGGAPATEYAAASEQMPGQQHAALSGPDDSGIAL